MPAGARVAVARRSGRPPTRPGALVLVGALGVAAVGLPACGLRVGSQQVRAATAAATGSGSGGPATGAGGAGLAAGTGTASGAGPGGGSASANAGGAGTGAAGLSGASGGGLGGGSSGGGSSGGAAAADGAGSGVGSPAPSGGNGGATDVGITASAITVGNVSDLGGPVPGLFQGGPYGVNAYFDYVNSQGGVFGRKLKMISADDGLQCSQNEAAYQDLVGKVFAFVGSWSLDDNCGAQVLARHPDIPVLNQALSPQAAAIPGQYSEVPFGQGAPLGFFQYYKSKYPDAITKVGTLVGNQASAVQNWKYSRQAMESLGYQVIYEDDFPPAQSNFTADVVRMRQQGVKMVYIVAVNAPDLAAFAKEANQQGWKPEVWASGIGYFGTYVQDSGGAQSVEGQYVNAGAARFLGEDAATVPEVALFDSWIQQAFPSFPIDQFAAYSWANAALFVHVLRSIGPNVTRKAVLAALANVHDFNDNGLISPTDVGAKRPGTCYTILRLHNGKYERVDDPPTGFRCDAGYYHYHG